MLTISQLAKKFDLSRSTILYYEREGLLRPSYRAANGYRYYNQTAQQRLTSIIAYRAFGIAVAKLPNLIDRNDKVVQEQILQTQFAALEQEITKLRQQQKAIVQLLQRPNLSEETMVTKQRWGEIMQAAGLNENDMKNWHQQFEKMEPEAHQEFLQSLSISKNEIKKIRIWSAS